MWETLAGAMTAQASAHYPSGSTERLSMNESPKYLEFNGRDQWRAWLEKHHAEEVEAWLVHYKKGFQENTLLLNEAIEEALCFGWIDGLLRRLDEQRYVLRYTPRRRNSVWSVSNIERVERLIREGRMTEAGLEKIAEAKANGQWDAALRREQVDIIPLELEKALRRRKGAIAAYRALPASQKKQYIYWLQTAKREETLQRRVEKIVNEVTGEGV
jgi:uncharacterized protein YdeI (YjbR/CyaY-like superfamily)